MIPKLDFTLNVQDDDGVGAEVEQTRFFSKFLSRFLACRDLFSLLYV